MSEPITKDVLKTELNGLTEALDGRVNKRFDEFGFKLFKYLDKRFDEVNKRIDALDKKYDKLLTTLDAFLKRLDNIEIDNAARDAQLARLERWIEQVAKKSGIRLEY